MVKHMAKDLRELGLNRNFKQGGSMTKEMNAGHHYDVLNDFKNFWNWTRVQKMCKVLYIGIEHD